MNKFEIVLNEMENETEKKTLSVDYEEDMEVEWRLEISSGSAPESKITFRSAGSERNPVYRFINNLILNDTLKSTKDIDSINIEDKGVITRIPGKKIKNILSTNSVLSCELVITLRNLAAEDGLPFDKGE